MKKITQGFSRFVTIDAAIDSEARTVRAALSSETPTREYFGQEVLKHDADSIDLSRAADGLPMLFNHDPNQPIGVIRDLAIEDGVLRGTLHFSRNARASEIWADVEAGFLRNMSVSGERLEWTEHDFGIITTKWAILEGSVVSVPADASVGINRNHKPEGLTMGDNNTPEDNNASDSTIKVVEFQRAREDAKKQGLDEGAKIERARQDGIRTVFAPFQGEHYNALRDTCIEKGSSIEQARAALLDLIGTGAEPDGLATNRAR